MTIGIIRDVRSLASSGRFAAHKGTAPIEASSGPHEIPSNHRRSTSLARPKAPQLQPPSAPSFCIDFRGGFASRSEPEGLSHGSHTRRTMFPRASIPSGQGVELNNLSGVTKAIGRS